MKIIITIGIIGLIITGCNFNSDDNKIENNNFQKSEIQNNLSFDEQEELLNSNENKLKVKKDSNSSKKVNDKNSSKEDSFSFDKKEINKLNEIFTRGSEDLGKDISMKANEYSIKAIKVTKETAAKAFKATKQGLSDGANWSKNYAKNWLAETWEEAKKEHAIKKEAAAKKSLK